MARWIHLLKQNCIQTALASIHHRPPILRATPTQTLLTSIQIYCAPSAESSRPCWSGCRAARAAEPRRAANRSIKPRVVESQCSGYMLSAVLLCGFDRLRFRFIIIIICITM